MVDANSMNLNQVIIDFKKMKKKNHISQLKFYAMEFHSDTDQKNGTRVHKIDEQNINC